MEVKQLSAPVVERKYELNYIYPNTLASENHRFSASCSLPFYINFKLEKDYVVFHDPHSLQVHDQDTIGSRLAK